MSEVVRVSPNEAKGLIAEQGALLVTAYESGFKFDAVAIEGAMAIDTFRSKEAEVAKDSNIIFY